MPSAQPGILAPYQERPKTYPLQFVLHFDPVADAGKLYPLLMTVGDMAATASKNALDGQLATLNQHFAQLYQHTQEHFANFSATHVSIDTPDPVLNQAFSWAEVAIDQLRVQTTPRAR